MGWFLLSVRIGLGAMFLVFGGQKVFATGIAEFAKAISHYQMFLDPWNLILAYGLAWVEIIAGLCLICGVLTRGAVLASLGMTGIFLFGIGQAWARGLDISCGCFGKSEVAVNYPLHFSGLLLMLGAFARLWWIPERPIFPLEKPEEPGDSDVPEKKSAAETVSAH